MLLLLPCWASRLPPTELGCRFILPRSIPISAPIIHQGGLVDNKAAVFTAILDMAGPDRFCPRIAHGAPWKKAESHYIRLIHRNLPSL